jgi:hypothetical protein
MNAGNYIAGLIFGVIYHEFKDFSKDRKKSKTHTAIWFSSFFAGSLISMLGFPFYELNIETSIWTALFGGFMKHYHGLLIGIFTLGIIFEYGHWILLKICNFQIFTFFGRLSYSYFICHVFIMKLLILGSNQLLELSNHNLVTIFFLHVDRTTIYYFSGRTLAAHFSLEICWRFRSQF